MRKINRAIISVTDKTGIASFAKELASMGVEIISTGGTAELLKKEGIKVIPIQSYTGFPEMLDGRVKTLHPKIHGGILYMRDNPEHKKQVDEHGILPIDMIIVNLYAFEDTIKKGVDLDEAIENIDIGGPTMLRAAAKNYKGVATVTDPADYSCIIEEMKKNSGSISKQTRFGLAKKVFQTTAKYDAAISNYLGTYSNDEEKAGDYPETYSVQYRKIQDLRYGENPHQSAAFYGKAPFENSTLATAKQLQGKELSFNNLLDINSALEISREFAEPACVIIKHNNPCGAAVSKDGLYKAYELALSTDSRSAFGGIVGFNTTVDAKLAEKMGDLFLEAIVAPGYDKAALEIFSKKKNLRVLEVAKPTGKIDLGYDIKRVSGGILLQNADFGSASDLKTATKRGATDKELEDLLFAWKICKHVKSNAIIFARDLRTVGIGAGQMSRIDSTNIATMKAKDAGLDVAGSVMASDAFFPFRDNVDMAAKNGITAIIQPGGSIRDEEVVGAADEHNIAMLFTGIRHFKH